MPFCGGLSPGPWRCGGGEDGTRDPRMKRIVESIQQQRGPAFTQSLQSVVGIENIAMARAIDRDAYGAMERLACDFDPQRMQFMLPRWEAIFGITPSPTDSYGVRRKRIAARWAMIGQPNIGSAVQAAMQVLLGPVFVGVQTFTVEVPGGSLPTFPGESWWPGISGSAGIISSIPGGSPEVVILTNLTSVDVYNDVKGESIVISNAANAVNNGTFLIVSLASSTSVRIVNPTSLAVAPDYGVGGTALAPTVQWQVVNPFNSWSSTAANIAIQVTQPPSYSNAQFYAAIAQIDPFLDGFMPAWSTWNWWISSPNGNGQMGFYLDEPNLDLEMLTFI